MTNITNFSQFLDYFATDFIDQIFQDRNMLFNPNNPNLQTVNLSTGFKNQLANLDHKVDLTQNDSEIATALNDLIFRVLHNQFTKQIAPILIKYWEAEKSYQDGSWKVQAINYDLANCDLNENNGFLVEQLYQTNLALEQSQSLYLNYQDQIKQLRQQVLNAWFNFDFGQL